MKLGSAAGVVDDAQSALGRLCEQAESAHDGTPADLVFLFVTSHFEDEAADIVQTVVRRHPSAILIGSSAEGVIGGDAEYERTPAIAVLLMNLPNVKLTPFHLAKDVFTRDLSSENLRKWVDTEPAEEPTFFLFGDPFTLPITPLLTCFDQAFPHRPVFGGMCSGVERPGQSVLILDDQVHREGAVGVAVSGDVQIQPVVSQGCRPIGEPMVITAAEGQIIKQLGGVPAFERLRETVESLSPDDQSLARQALFIGQVINEYQESFSQGDFLIRNLVGFEPQSGALAVGDAMRTGTTVQFHVRDAKSADQDLRQMLTAAIRQGQTAGGLLFSCNGRGTRMWTEPNHDLRVAHELLNSAPLAGFFAAGELGPVGGRNFIHGHTASMALFRPKPT